MPRLTRHLLASIDYPAVLRRRQENFASLHRCLGELNQLPLPDLAPGDAPLCYPFLARDCGLRDTLAENRIYTATYWREVEARTTPDAIERTWVDRLVPLPIDQRYSEADMLRVAHVVQASAG
jgi:hypothetical protein